MDSQKLTTCGKTSRNLKSDSHSTELDQSACQSSPIYQETKAQIEMKATGQSSPTNFPYPRATHSQGDPSQHSLRALVRSRVLVGPHRNVFDRSASNSSKEKKMLVTHEDDTVFEVPSSDSEQFIRLKASGSLLKRKRRNGRPGHITDEPGSVCEDVGLQRHVAAELRKDQHLSPGARNNAQAISRCWVHEQEFGDVEVPDQHQLKRVLRMPSALDQASADHIVPNSNLASVRTPTYPTNQSSWFSNNKGSALIREGHLERSPLNNCDHSAITQQDTTDTVKPTLTGVRGGSNHGVMQDVDSNCHQIGSPISSDIENPSRAPASRKSFPRPSLSRTTTPRQKELWNLLLNDCEQKVTHSRCSFMSTRNKECDKAKFKRSGLPSKISNLTNPVSGILPTRRRLVDNLHQTDDNFMKGTDNVEDGGRSILSPRKPALNPRKKNASPAAASKLDLVPITTPCHIVQEHTYVVPGTNHLVPLQQCGALKVTYARERSFLTDDDVSQQGCLDTAITTEVASDARRKRRAARDVAIFQKLEVLTGDLDEVSDYQSSAMRSIHELREAGVNARVFSEMEAMLDDIDEASASAPKRSKLLELATKLQELSFCRLFSDQGLDQRIFSQLVSTKDVLVDTLVATIVLSLLAGSASTSKLHQMRASRMISFMIGLLDRNQDLALSTRNRTLNISRVAQRQFKILWDLLLKSSTWRVSRPTVLTPRVISLQCLEYIVRRIRENGCVDIIFSAGDIRSIVQLLQADPSAESQQQQSSLNAELHLSVSILESWTICKDPSCKDPIWTGHTLGIVTGLLARLDSLPTVDVGTLRTLTLRLYLNLTNNNPEICAAFSKPGVVGSILNIVVSHFQTLSEASTEEMPEVMLDNLILALGSMINLAEWSDAVRLIVMRLEFMHTCFIDILLQLFLRKQRTAAEVFSEREASLNVAFGYLSVLLCYLCLNKTVRFMVSSQLQGGSLKQLLDAVREFLSYHREIDADIHQDEEGVEAKADFVARLQRLIEELKLELDVGLLE